MKTYRKLSNGMIHYIPFSHLQTHNECAKPHVWQKLSLLFSDRSIDLNFSELGNISNAYT